MFTLKVCKRPFTVNYLITTIGDSPWWRYYLQSVFFECSGGSMYGGGRRGRTFGERSPFKPKPRSKFTWCETLILKINIFLIATRCIILVLSILIVLSAYLTRRSEVSALSFWKGVGSWKGRSIFSDILMLFSPDLWYRCLWSIYNFSVFIHSFSSYLRQRNYGPARY